MCKFYFQKTGTINFWCTSPKLFKLKRKSTMFNIEPSSMAYAEILLNIFNLSDYKKHKHINLIHFNVHRPICKTFF